MQESMIITQYHIDMLIMMNNTSIMMDIIQTHRSQVHVTWNLMDQISRALCLQYNNIKQFTVFWVAVTISQDILIIVIKSSKKWEVRRKLFWIRKTDEIGNADAKGSP